MRTIECTTLGGKKLQIPKEELNLRVSVYGVTLYDNAVLLVEGYTSGCLCYPGGGLEIGETLEETLRREYREETGIELGTLEFLTLREEFFYHENWKKAFYSLRSYFLRFPMTTNLIGDDQNIAGESKKPKWVEITSLSPPLFDQEYGMEILQLVLQRL